MRIAILSCFYPFRGGISQFNAALLAELGKCHDVRAFNFKRQYPAFLFPGKTQFVTPEDEAAPVESTATLDSINPFSWLRTAGAIKAWKPDLLILPYWMSWFAPSLGFTARRCKSRCIGLAHNLIPHEPHWFDRPLARYFAKPCRGFVTMAGSVTEDLKQICPGKPYIQLQHPLYTHFGEKLTREEAAKLLGTDPSAKTILFFGLIRDYKGLDILLEAFRELPEDYQLIVAGEPYGSFEKYRSLIDSLPGKDRVHLFLNYVRDSEVKRYFSAADLVVLPYRSATQSGISSVAYHFGVPMVVTDVGGLKESIGDRGTGIVAEAPAPEAIKASILRYFNDSTLQHSCKQAIEAEKQRLGWDAYCKALTGFAQTL